VRYLRLTWPHFEFKALDQALQVRIRARERVGHFEEFTLAQLREQAAPRANPLPKSITRGRLAPAPSLPVPLQDTEWYSACPGLSMGYETS
jgi:hypothetical protein